MKFLSALLLISVTASAQQMQFKVKDAREEVPHFKHNYIATTELRGHVEFDLAAETRPSFVCYDYPDMRPCGDVPRRQFVVTLTQADGKVLAFEPKHIPDRLIDRDLVPWVREACRWALIYDGQFIANNPSEFIAADGWHWKRVDKEPRASGRR